MLELYILKHLMRCEEKSSLMAGEFTGWSISFIRRDFNIPKSTFHRSINTLLNENMIVRKYRGLYAVSPDFRYRCNCMGDSTKVA